MLEIEVGTVVPKLSGREVARIVTNGKVTIFHVDSFERVIELFERKQERYFTVTDLESAVWFKGETLEIYLNK